MATKKPATKAHGKAPASPAQKPDLLATPPPPPQQWVKGLERQHP
jgi:hypothetical protein